MTGLDVDYKEPSKSKWKSCLILVQDCGHSRKFEWAFLGLYAFLLALLTARHVMWFDEVQAWLIARNSTSIADLFYNLRSEGHPALWYMLLYIPAHISWNPVSIQAINYLFSVVEAWLILSARKLPWSIRALAIFSYYGFYQYAVYARSYMLAMLLLTAAARCLLGEREHRKLAVLFLALSINTHVFAIPIAAALAVQMFYPSKLNSRKNLGMLFRDFEFWATSAVLLASVCASYFTVRQSANASTPQYAAAQHSTPYYFLSTESQAWRALIGPNHLTDRLYDWLASHHRPIVPIAVLSLALILLLAAALRTAQARSILFVAFSLEFLAIAETVHQPRTHHLGLIFLVFILALLIDAYTAPNINSRPWLSRPVAFAVVLAILSLQALEAASSYRAEWSHLSMAKATGSWLKQTGFSKNPLVMEGNYEGAAVLTYMERSSAYYPACSCVTSFVVWSEGRGKNRMVTEDELEGLSRSSPLPVIVVSGTELPPETLKSLRLQELRAFSGVMAEGSFYVYQRL
jgi:hypothetical protein